MFLFCGIHIAAVFVSSSSQNQFLGFKYCSLIIAKSTSCPIASWSKSASAVLLLCIFAWRNLIILFRIFKYQTSVRTCHVSYLTSRLLLAFFKLMACFCAPKTKVSSVRAFPPPLRVAQSQTFVLPFTFSKYPNFTANPSNLTRCICNSLFAYALDIFMISLLISLLFGPLTFAVISADGLFKSSLMAFTTSRQWCKNLGLLFQL